MRITLVRHGQTPSNVDGLLDTAAPGPGLTALGRRQADAIPGAFDGRPVGLIAVSDLVRTAETASPLAAARGLEPVVMPGLAEITAGDFEMHHDDDAVRTYIETVFTWAGGDRGLRMPGGEDGQEFFDRYDAAVLAIAERGVEHAVVVSHGAAIRTWTSARVQGVRLEYVERHSMPNTAYVVFEGDPADGWTLVDWHGEPAGGAGLLPRVEDDPTGEPVPE